LVCDYDEFEVIVVENRPGSSATLRMIAERFAEEPRLRYVEESSPGLSRARNAGLRVAEGEVVAFTDDDVIVDSAWIRRCAKAFERADDVACVTGLILPRELQTCSQLLLEQFAGFGKGFRRRTYRLREARGADPLFPYTPGMIGSGANTVLRADVGRHLGGFETRLGAGTPARGGEDLELYIRLLYEGYAIAYEPGAIVWHEHPDGTARLRRQVYGYGVGLGAMLTQQLVAGPERSALLRAVPAGISYARDPGSRKNALKRADYPRRLDWLERVGMVVGPAAYIASAVMATRRALRES
jgi:O-antigen biosynthesis protein